MLNMSSKVWMVLSDYPSDLGWKVVLRCNFVPMDAWNPLQDLKINLYLDLTQH